MSQHASTALVETWQRRAARLREWGADSVAAIWRLAADELEAYERERAWEALTLRQAELESGYSASHLGRMIAAGKMENVGRPGAPRVRRGDLPRKGREPIRRNANGDPDLVGEALAAQGVKVAP